MLRMSILCSVQNVRAYSKISLKKRPKLLGTYTSLPCELFRVNPTPKVILRDHDTQIANNHSSYDLFLDSNGFVQPSPPTGLFERPNGMSLRPNGPFLQELIRGFLGKNVTIYRLPKGLDLASLNLTCLWEHSDHHSVQTTVPIKLDALNKKLTQMCLQKGERMTKDEFLEKFPFQDCI